MLLNFGVGEGFENATDSQENQMDHETNKSWVLT